MTQPLKDQVVDKVEDKLDDLADKDVDSTDSDLRYMAYGARLRTALRAGHRYIAYVSTPPARPADHSDRFTPDQ